MKTFTIFMYGFAPGKRKETHDISNPCGLLVRYSFLPRAKPTSSQGFIHFMLMILQFGKYKGVDLKDIPTPYLEWLLENNTTLLQHTITAIAEELQARENVLINTNQSNLAIIYRDLAKKYHPDKGGSTQAMQAINEFYQKLKTVVK